MKKLNWKKMGRKNASEVYWALIRKTPDIEKAIKILDDYYKIKTRFSIKKDD
jgi:hypothetical protein